MDYIIKQTKCGGIAQSVEQRTENPCVPGSIPGPATIFFALKRAKKITKSSAVAEGYGGISKSSLHRAVRHNFTQKAIVFSSHLHLITIQPYFLSHFITYDILREHQGNLKTPGRSKKNALDKSSVTGQHIFASAALHTTVIQRGNAPKDPEERDLTVKNDV